MIKQEVDWQRSVRWLNIALNALCYLVITLFWGTLALICLATVPPITPLTIAGWYASVMYCMTREKR